jgi:hypothetical protein
MCNNGHSFATVYLLTSPLHFYESCEFVSSQAIREIVSAESFSFSRKVFLRRVGEVCMRCRKVLLTRVELIRLQTRRCDNMSSRSSGVPMTLLTALSTGCVALQVLNCFCMRRHRTCEEGPNLSTQPRTNACFVLVTQVCAFGQVLEELAVRYTFVRVVDHKDHGLRWRTV